MQGDSFLKRAARLIRAGLACVGLGAVCAPAATAQQSPSSLGLPGFSGPVSLGLGAGEPRRFTYYDLDETRARRALRSFGLSFGGIDDELGALLSFPLREPKTTALFLIGTAALISVDRQTTAWWQDNVETTLDGVSLPDLGFGPPQMSLETKYLVAAAGLTYAGGLAFNDERAQTAALLSIKAVGYSYLTSQLILKPVFGRLRPIDDLSGGAGPSGDFTDDPWQFGYSQGIPFVGGAYGTSMPSFHFTQYFAVARVYSGIYDNSPVPYVAAGLLSAVNIRGHNHWVSDMVAGTVIGIGIGNLVLNQYEARKDRRDRGLVLPVVGPEGIGLSYTRRF